jgi:hypothetical protein
MDRLVESKAKIIQTSSIGAKVFGHIKLEDFPYRFRTPLWKYGDTKLANILFTNELHRRYFTQGPIGRLLDTPEGR